MTSKAQDSEAFVWTWLPGQTEPVVAGRIARDGERMLFNYGRSYLERKGAISLYLPELPLRSGAIAPLAGLSMAGCLRDGAPDAWGRRVIINRKLGHKGAHADPAELDELTYLLESGSDRIGALDFQRSASHYVPRGAGAASLDELMTAAERVEAGVLLTPDLDIALFHGSSIGGARPKAAVDDGERKFVAKFSSRDDVFNVVKGEFVAMRLAAHVGLDVAPVELRRTAGKDVLLIERFDRERAAGGLCRKGMVSALTLLQLDEMMARYASYETLAEIVRHRFTSPDATLRELFGRLVFNILCGNTDDHARNHAAFWDGAALTLTPAYDICPQARAGREATQAMLIAGDVRMSTLATCIQAAAQFHLDEAQATQIVERQLEAMVAHWPEISEEAGLTDVERAALWGRRLLNPFAFMGAPRALVRFATDA